MDNMPKRLKPTKPGQWVVIDDPDNHWLGIIVRDRRGLLATRGVLDSHHHYIGSQQNNLVVFPDDCVISEEEAMRRLLASGH